MDDHDRAYSNIKDIMCRCLDSVNAGQAEVTIKQVATMYYSYRRASGIAKRLDGPITTTIKVVRFGR